MRGHMPHYFGVPELGTPVPRFDTPRSMAGDRNGPQPETFRSRLSMHATGYIPIEC